MDATNLSDIPPNRKKACFLSFCPATVFNTATALLAPQTVKTVTWEELQEVLGNHYAPKPSCITCRHAFRRRSQVEGESVGEYMAALHSAALQCGFRDQLDDMLLDQLACGVRDLRLQRRLLAKADLNLKQAIEEAQAAKLSNLSAAKIQKASSLPGGKPSSAVHYEDTYFEEEDLKEEEEINCVRTPQPTQRRSLPTDRRQLTPQLICLSYGENHLRATCCFRNTVCLKCQKKGHLARICQAPRNTNLPSQHLNQPKNFKSKEECYAINKVFPRAESLPYSFNVNKINVGLPLEGSPCQMEVDTGSSLSLISWKTLKNLLPDFKRKQLSPCSLSPRDYQGQPIPVLGTGKSISL
ncbi:hypothetical protein E2320_009098 [Naja naja]|nr:hypothetical protein E2320_009098 [Naja naja]